MNKYKKDTVSLKEDNGQIYHYEITDIDKTLSEIHGNKYIEYRKKWDYASKLKEIGHPLYIVMETNTYCNMKCKMCIRNFDNSKNTAKNVPIENIKKVVCEARNIGVPSFLIGAEAECLINPNIKKIIRVVKEEGGGIDNFLISNGYELTDDIINLLIDLQWERLYISLDAARPETYRKIRGMDLNHVEKNIKNFIRIRDERKSSLPLIRVSFVIQEDNINERSEFLDKWKDVVDIIDFQNLIHYEDMEIKECVPDVNYQCAYPFRTLLVDCNGNLYPCCTEYGYKMPIGNISHMSIEEAWNSRIMRGLRESMLKKELCSVCRNCAAHIDNSVIV